MINIQPPDTLPPHRQAQLVPDTSVPSGSVSKSSLNLDATAFTGRWHALREPVNRPAGMTVSADVPGSAVSHPTCRNRQSSNAPSTTPGVENCQTSVTPCVATQFTAMMRKAVFSGTTKPVRTSVTGGSGTTLRITCCRMMTFLPCR